MEKVECLEQVLFPSWLDEPQFDTIAEWRKQNGDDLQNYGHYSNRRMFEDEFERDHKIRMDMCSDFGCCEKQGIQPFCSGWLRLQSKAHCNGWIIPIPVDLRKDLMDTSKETKWIPKDLQTITEDHGGSIRNITVEKRKQPHLTVRTMMQLLYGEWFGEADKAHPVFVQMPLKELQSGETFPTSETMIVRTENTDSFLQYQFVVKRIANGKYAGMDYLEARVESLVPKDCSPKQVVKKWETLTARVPQMIEAIKQGATTSQEETTGQGSVREVVDENEAQDVSPRKQKSEQA